MGNGEDSGTWGSITNTNWNLIEQAVSGVQSITMANANYTLSNLNGVSDEARNMVLVATGTNSAIYQVIVPTNQPKFYVITNSTTGGYAITIGTSGGSVITVPNGTTIQVYTDGTNTFSAQTSSAGNFNVNGNLTVAGTSTLTGSTSVGSNLNVNGTTTIYALNSTSINASTGSFTGNVASLGGVSGASGTFGPVSGTSGSFSGNLSVIGTSSFTGIPSGPTAADGTNTTQLATTAFVTTAVANAFPSGTRLVFAQAAAPTGWTQDTSDTANNRMMRVVSSTGGGLGGTADPTLMNVVPYHTHGFTSGYQSANHYHYATGTTAGQNNDHYHYVSANTTYTDINHTHYFAANTGGMSGNNPHSHGTPFFIEPSAGGNPGFAGGGLYTNTQSNTGTYAANIDHSHYVAGTTGYMDQNVNHLHNFSANSGTTSNTHAHDYGNNTGYVNADHTHSGSTDGGSSQTNWAPRYNNVIICQKN